jgi:two-component system, OmpR family, sensor histidine kinase KdpD
MLLPEHLDTTIAALVYVLAVIAAAAAGGLVAGVVASLLSFLGLNFFFTQPLHTLRVEKIEDVVALSALLIVSTVVATLYSSATQHRQTAERGERETRLLYEAGRHLLAGKPERDVLEDFASAAVKMFDLARCEIRTDAVADPVVVGSPDGDDPPNRSTVPIAVRDREVGRIILVPEPGRPRLDTNEEAVVRAFAGQIALHEEGERLATEVRGARMDAETSNLRAALFSSVTHELRTPLSSITASVTNLLDLGEEIPETDRVELLETIRDEAHRLNRLVGNLLDLARVRAGAVIPAMQLASINEVIEGVSARLNKRLGDRRLRLVLRENVPEVWLDLDQMDQVVTNLIENGLAYGRTGTDVTISSALWHDTVEVRVTDQGPGIPPEDRERVFEPFVRGETSREGGSGLGLAIARAFVEAHGGTIWIEGAPTGGATFVFRLPKEG